MALSRGKDGKRQPLLRLGSLPKTKPYEADKGSNSALNVDDPYDFVDSQSLQPEPAVTPHLLTAATPHRTVRATGSKKSTPQPRKKQRTPVTATKKLQAEAQLQLREKIELERALEESRKEAVRVERRQRRQRRDDEATVREEEIAGNVVSSSRRTDEALTAVSSPQGPGCSESSDDLSQSTPPLNGVCSESVTTQSRVAAVPRTPVLQVVKLSNNRSRMLPVSHRGGGEGGDLGEGGDGDGGAGNEGNWLEETPPLGDKRDSGNREEGKEMERGEDRPAQVEANSHCMSDVHQRKSLLLSLRRGKKRLSAEVGGESAYAPSHKKTKTTDGTLITECGRPVHETVNLVQSQVLLSQSSASPSTVRRKVDNTKSSVSGKTQLPDMFAPNGVEPASYTATILRVFNSYIHQLRLAQAKVLFRVPWSKSVPSYSRQPRSTLAYRRSRPRGRSTGVTHGWPTIDLNTGEVGRWSPGASGSGNRLSTRRSKRWASFVEDDELTPPPQMSATRTPSRPRHTEKCKISSEDDSQWFVPVQPSKRHRASISGPSHSTTPTPPRQSPATVKHSFSPVLDSGPVLHSNPLESGPKPHSNPLESGPEPHPNPLESGPEPHPNPLESSPKPHSNPLESGPEPHSNPLESSPKPHSNPLESGPEPHSNPLESGPEPHSNPLESGPEPHSNPLESGPEPHSNPLESGPEPHPNPLESGPEPHSNPLESGPKPHSNPLESGPEPHSNPLESSPKPHSNPLESGPEPHSNPLESCPPMSEPQSGVQMQGGQTEGSGVRKQGDGSWSGDPVVAEPNPHPSKPCNVVIEPSGHSCSDTTTSDQCRSPSDSRSPQPVTELDTVTELDSPCQALQGREMIGDILSRDGRGRGREVIGDVLSSEEIGRQYSSSKRRRRRGACIMEDSGSETEAEGGDSKNIVNDDAILDKNSNAAGHVKTVSQYASALAGCSRGKRSKRSSFKQLSVTSVRGSKQPQLSNTATDDDVIDLTANTVPSPSLSPPGPSSPSLGHVLQCGQPKEMHEGAVRKEEEEERVVCPLCGERFAVSVIEAHAASCREPCTTSPPLHRATSTQRQTILLTPRFRRVRVLSSSPSRSPEPSCAAVDNTEEGEGEEGDDGEEGEGEEGEEMEGMQRLPGTDEGPQVYECEGGGFQVDPTTISTSPIRTFRRLTDLDPQERDGYYNQFKKKGRGGRRTGSTEYTSARRGRGQTGRGRGQTGSRRGRWKGYGKQRFYRGRGKRTG